MIDNASEGNGPSLIACPHCKVVGEVHWLKEAALRYKALGLSEDAVSIDGSTLLIIRYDDNRLICEHCGREIEIEGREVETVTPGFQLDADAVQRGFAADRNRTEVPLAVLAGGGLESFGEFARSVVAAAQHDWLAISGPEGATVQLQPLFPNGEQLLPMVTWKDQPALHLAGPTGSRDALVSAIDRGLATACADTAAILCGFAVDAANEILGHPQAVAHFFE
jgi:hypothetical protein